MKNNLTKQLGALLIVSIFVFLAFGSTDDSFGPNSEFKKASSIDEALQVIESSLTQFQNEYNDLCAGAKNRNLRDKFLDLEKKIAELPSKAEKCEKLNYDEQRELRIQIELAIANRENLKNLFEGNIDCWK
jgi:hypothetical protein